MVVVLATSMRGKLETVTNTLSNDGKGQDVLVACKKYVVVEVGDTEGFGTVELNPIGDELQT